MAKAKSKPKKGARPGVTKTRKQRGVEIRKTARPEDDDYPTPPEAVRSLFARERMPLDVVDPCAGAGILAAVMRDEYSCKVVATTLTNYGDRFRLGIKHGVDIMKDRPQVKPHGAIVTNLPYHLVEDTKGEIINMLLDCNPSRLCLFMPVSFEESNERLKNVFTRRAPTRIHKFSNRLTLIPHRLFEGKHDPDFESGGSVAFAWYVWSAPFGPPPSQTFWIDSRPYKKFEDIEKYQVDYPKRGRQGRLL